MVTAAFNHGAIKAALTVVLACVFAGCVVTTQSRTGNQGQGQTGGNLIKPYIPPDANPPASESPVPPGEPAPMAPEGTSSKSVRPETAPEAEVPEGPQSSAAGGGLKKPELQVKPAPAQSDKALWEDQKVKRAAMQMLNKYPGAKKVKICYAVKDDEWWVILYDDLDTHFELRQFTWDRDQGRLQPFLVLKRISKNQLRDHLASSEPDRACEVLDPAPVKAEAGETPADF
ncbi:MAG: hypothetical protein V1792_25545 [Pseudomonadota bacterium]